MDPIADALIRIKNGYQVGRQSVSIRYSKLIFKLMKLLQSEGYVGEAEQKGQEVEVLLKYNARKPAISGIKRVSKPSQRIYKGVAQLPFVLNGLGIAIVSTPQGLMTDKEARKSKVGGEILALIW